LAWNRNSLSTFKLYGEGVNVHIWNRPTNSFSAPITTQCNAMINGGQSSIGQGLQFMITDAAN